MVARQIGITRRQFFATCVGGALGVTLAPRIADNVLWKNRWWGPSATVRNRLYFSEISRIADETPRHVTMVKNAYLADTETWFVYQNRAGGPPLLFYSPTQMDAVRRLACSPQS